MANETQYFELGEDFSSAQQPSSSSHREESGRNVNDDYFNTVTNITIGHKSATKDLNESIDIEYVVEKNQEQQEIICDLRKQLSHIHDAQKTSESTLIELAEKLSSKQYKVANENLRELKNRYRNLVTQEKYVREMLRIETDKSNKYKDEVERKKEQLLEATEIISKLKDKTEELKHKLKVGERSNEANELNHCKQEISKLNTEIMRTNRILKIRESEMANLQRHYNDTESELSSHIEELQKALEDTQKKYRNHLDECLSSGNQQRGIESGEYMEKLQQELGSLKTTNTYLEKEKQQLCEDLEKVKIELNLCRDDVKSLVNEKNSLTEKMENIQGDHQLTSQFLNEQNEKLRESKAKIRCDLVLLKREHQSLVDEHKECLEYKVMSGNLKERVESIEDQNKKLESELERLKSENESLRKEIGNKERSVSEIQAKYDALSTTMQTIEKEDVSQKEELKKEILKLRRELSLNEETLKTLDAQCDSLAKNNKSLKESRKVKSEEIMNLKNEIEMWKHKEASFNDLKIEKIKLEKKVEFLEEELRETTEDYKNEIRDLAASLQNAKLRENSESSLEMKDRLDTLERERVQLESQIRCFQRQVDNLKKELKDREDELADKKSVQSKYTEEHEEVLNGLKLAIEKCERYKNENETLKDLLQNKESTMKSFTDKQNELESEIFELKEDIEQKDKLIVYLQSQIQIKQLPKLKYNPSSATLISNPEADSYEGKSKENYGTSSFSFKNSRTKSQVLSDSSGEKNVLQTMSKSYTYHNVSSSSKEKPFVTLTPSKMPKDDPQNEGKSNDVMERSIGTMRHNIPHRWKLFFAIKQVKCDHCGDGLSRLRYANRCTECGVNVHVKCTRRMPNTCGLPTDCAKFYMDTKSGNGMMGWVKLLISTSTSKHEKWEKYFAKLRNGTLRFFDEENLASDNDEAHLVVDLMREQWKFYQQTGQAVNGVENEAMKRLIEIKLPGFNIFMLSPTEQAKQRWVKALQSINNRQQGQRKNKSGGGTDVQMLLCLDSPQNLAINATIIFDDYLVIGANEGLFATQLQNGRMPFSIAGVTSVQIMEIIPELNMLIIVCGHHKQLSIVHLSQLRSSFVNPRNGVNPTPVCNLRNCHIMVVSPPDHNTSRHLYVATMDAIHILQHNKKLDMFNVIKVIRTKEPCNSILSIPGGFVYAADTFYFVNNNDQSEKSLDVSDYVEDYPLEALFVGDDEILLAFHNYGIFVNTKGQRTRASNVEWPQVPLCFVYCNNYLFIAHYDSLEIFKIAPVGDFNDTTQPIVKYVEEYKCSNVQFTGYGKTKKEVLFSLSSDVRVEVHKFTCNNI
uniref:Phorbol-ester/DAG-type domain-containing protein n=1 Tax=Strongyloides papillosus TaxID=174720 RepID=A0A0N5B9N2_STREA